MTKTTKKILLIPIFLIILALLAVACGSSPKPTSPLPKPSANPAPLPLPTPSTTSSPATPAPAPTQPGVKPAGLIRSTKVQPKIDGDNYSVAVSDVLKYWNLYFEMQTPKGLEGFMAYTMDGKEIYLRASICVPCRGKTYSLNGDILVCDTCGTTYSAKTGRGIDGPCVAYPKAAPAYQIIDGQMTTNRSALLTAFDETLKREPGYPGKP